MKHLLQGLNENQQTAVRHDGGPLLIVAGAGTGKTTVITRRLAWLIESGKAKSDHILALTFTDKAATEMIERLDKLLPYGYVDLWVSTFHSFAERLLHEHALDIGVPHDFKLLNETEQWLLVRRNLDRFNLDYYRPLGSPNKFIHALLRHFSRAKDEEIYPEDYLSYAESLVFNGDTEIKTKKQSGATEEDEAGRVREIADAYHMYQQLLLENNALDFGDLVNYCLKLFRTRKDILARYQEHFQFVLVDEFQDTNWAQYELVKLLAEPNNNLTVVGDDDQSIYRFRGASMSNILQFRDDYPKAKSVVLTTNYRSAQNILDAAYEFITQNNPNRLEHQLAKNGMNKKLTAASDEVGLLQHLCGQTKEDEYALVIEKIKKLQANDKDASWGDFAILARSNAQANEVDLALGLAGVPHQSFTSKGLYKKPVIVDALAYLKVLDNFHDSTSLWRVLNFTFFNIVPRDLITLSHTAQKKTQSLYEILNEASAVPNLSEETQGQLKVLLGHLHEHASFAQSRRPTELLVKALNDIGYTAHIESLGEERAKADFQFLNQFYERAKRWEETEADPRLRAFIEFVKLELESGEEGDIVVDPELGPDVVRVMTVHTAKGLEFRYVFIVGLVDRRFPSIGRAEPIVLPDELVKERLPQGDAHLEEERRLFYVAMTRAKRGLFLSSAENYGGVQKKKPSRFLTELGLPLSDPKRSEYASEFPKVVGDQIPATLAASYVPEHVSFTSLKAFQTCPWQYRYAHVLRVPVWGRHSLSFGQSMHRTLERFFKLLMAVQGTAQDSLFGDAPKSDAVGPSLATLLDLYESSWVDEWYPSKKIRDEYYARGRQALKDFYEKHNGKWPETGWVERAFALKVGTHIIRGKIDRIDKTNGGIEIVDYKTGRVPKNDKIEKDQLIIYQLASEALWKETPKALTFYYLNENKAISFVATQKDKTRVIDKITKTIEEIGKGDFTADPSPQKCKQCDYKAICPFSQA